MHGLEILNFSNLAAEVFRKYNDTQIKSDLRFRKLPGFVVLRSISNLEPVDKINSSPGSRSLLFDQSFKEISEKAQYFIKSYLWYLKPHYFSFNGYKNIQEGNGSGRIRN
jgi:hypothetical protein